METDIELLHAFDFAGQTQRAFGDARQTKWHEGLPYAKGLRIASEHLQEKLTDLPHTDWRFGVYRFQVDLIQRGYLQSFHLEPGEPVHTRLSFPAPGDDVLNPIFYYFAEPEPHYLLIGFHPARLVGFYFPERKQVVSLMNHEHPVIRMGWDPMRTALSCRMLEELLLIDPAVVAQYRTNEASHRLVLTQAFHPNVGHQLREEFSLLWKLFHKTDCDAGLLTGPHDHLGLADQLPATVQRENLPLDDPETPWPVTCFNATLQRGLLLGRMGCTSHMPVEMQQTLQTGFRKAHAAKLSEAAGQLAGKRPVVWLTLRAHNRRWLGEGEYLRKLTETVAEKYPNAAFILDGMKDTRKSAKEIMQSPATVLDLIGASFPEAQACFSLADAYVMPYSNSCVFHMIDPRPGVVHGLKGWIPEEPFEPAETAQPVRANVVHGTKKESGNPEYDAWVTAANYELDAEPVIASLLEVLASLPPRTVTT